MAVTLWGQFPKHDSEWDAVERISHVLEKQDDDHHVLVNFHPGAGAPQVDALVLSLRERNATAIVLEFKYAGEQKVRVSPNGPLQIGDAIPDADDFPLQQVRDEYWAVVNWLHANREELLGRREARLYGEPQRWWDVKKFLVICPGIAAGSEISTEGLEQFFSDSPVKGKRGAVLGLDTLLDLLIDRSWRSRHWAPLTDSAVRVFLEKEGFERLRVGARREEGREAHGEGRRTSVGNELQEPGRDGVQKPGQERKVITPSEQQRRVWRWLVLGGALLAGFVVWWMLLRPVVPEAGGPYSAVVGEEVAFSAYGSSGPIGRYVWSFGDGTIAVGKHAGHAFGAAGAYMATLTVLGRVGQQASDSFRVAVSAPPMADLTVESLTHLPSMPTLGQAISFRVVVRNRGAGRAGPFSVSISGTSSPAQTVAPQLVAGASTTLTMSLVASQEMETFTARVDDLGQVEESDEANNTLQDVIQATAAPIPCESCIRPDAAKDFIGQEETVCFKIGGWDDCGGSVCIFVEGFKWFTVEVKGASVRDIDRHLAVGDEVVVGPAPIVRASLENPNPQIELEVSELALLIKRCGRP